MAIPKTVTDYLERQHVSFRVVEHPHSDYSRQTARKAHVPASKVAKAVVLRNKRGEGHLLAVLPADRNLDIKALEDQVSMALEMVAEEDLKELFWDCALGAIPALGPAYGLHTVIDKHVVEQPDVYFEAGDHEELIHVLEPEFDRMLDGSDIVDISKPLE